jgi:hypothetical protein
MIKSNLELRSGVSAERRRFEVCGGLPARRYGQDGVSPLIISGES